MDSIYGYSGILITYGEFGKINWEGYYLKGNFHNENGPACTFFEANGLTNSHYYLYGKKYSEEDYYKQLQTKLYLVIYGI